MARRMTGPRVWQIRADVLAGKFNPDDLRELIEEHIELTERMHNIGMKLKSMSRNARTAEERKHIERIRALLRYDRGHTTEDIAKELMTPKR